MTNWNVTQLAVSIRKIQISIAGVYNELLIESFFQQH